MRSKVHDFYILQSKVKNGEVIQGLLDMIADLIEDEDTDNEVYEEIRDLLNTNGINYEE